MEKITLYVVLGAVVVLVGGAFYAGWHLKPTPKPPEPVVISLTEAQKDSLDAVWRQKFYIITHGTRTSRGKTDTVVTLVADTTEINGLCRLIEALTIPNPDIGVSAHQTPASAPTGGNWGLSIGMGGLYHFKDAGLMPVASLGIKHKKNSIHPLLGYYKGLMAGVVYERQF